MSFWGVTTKAFTVEAFDWIRGDKVLIVTKNDIIIKHIKEAKRPIFEMNIAMCDIDYKDNLLYLFQGNFLNDPDEIVLSYEKYWDIVNPKIDSIIERRANQISFGPRREHHLEKIKSKPSKDDRSIRFINLNKDQLEIRKLQTNPYFNSLLDIETNTQNKSPSKYDILLNGN